MSNKPVTHAECNANVGRVISKIDNVHEDTDEIKLILRGSEGRNGLVKDVNYLMNQSNTITMITSTAVGIIAAVITTVITHMVLG